MELNLLSLSIGIGLVVSLLLAEFFGLAAGGLVVPGYIALYMTRPIDVAATLGAALVTFFLVRIASTFIIVYGRRRTALMILVGYAAGLLINTALTAAFEASIEPFQEPSMDPLTLVQGGQQIVEASVIGFIVPGLIAIWLDRQGVVPTLALLVTSAVVVRLVLVLVVPDDLLWFEATWDLVPSAVEVGER